MEALKASGAVHKKKIKPHLSSPAGLLSCFTPDAEYLLASSGTLLQAKPTAPDQASGCGMLNAVSGSQNMHVLCQALGGRCKNAYVRGKGNIFAVLLNFCFTTPGADVKRVENTNPDDGTSERFKRGSKGF